MKEAGVAPPGVMPSQQPMRQLLSEVIQKRGNFRHVAERGVRETHAIAERRQPLARTTDRLGIAIEPEQVHVRTRPAQHRFRVTAHPDRPVDDPARPARSQREHDLVDQNRKVNYFTSSCASRSKPDCRPPSPLLFS